MTLSRKLDTPSKAALDAGLAAYREWFSSQPTLSPYASCPPQVPVKAAYPVIVAEMVTALREQAAQEGRQAARGHWLNAADFIEERFGNA